MVRACVFSPAVSIRWIDKIADPGPNKGEPNQKTPYIPAGSVKDSQAKVERARVIGRNRDWIVPSQWDDVVEFRLRGFGCRQPLGGHCSKWGGVIRSQVRMMLLGYIYRREKHAASDAALLGESGKQN